MNLPPFIDRAALATLASENDTHAVRVVLQRVNNSGIFRLRCKNRTYIFERDGAVGTHILDVPVSVWMDGIPAGRYAPNRSIAQDLQPTLQTPIILLVVPWKTAVAAESPAAAEGSVPASPDLLPMLGELLVKLAAPPIMTEALTVMQTGDPSAFRAFIDSIQVEGVDAPAVEQTPAGPRPQGSPRKADPSPVALRMRAYRERKKAGAAKKAAGKKRAAQP